jgi:DNA-directed RNA polymerase specialized sigma24 family protein
MRQNVRIRKRKVRIVPDAEQGAFILYQMKRRRLTMAEIATICDVSVPSVHTVVWGKRTSARIQKQIATSLGYSSWLELLSTRKEIAA